MKENTAYGRKGMTEKTGPSCDLYGSSPFLCQFHWLAMEVLLIYLYMAIVSLVLLFVEFNAVTRTCIQDLVPAMLRHLNLPKSKGTEPVLPSCSPQWKKIRLHVKAYVGDVIEVMPCLQYTDAVMLEMGRSSGP